MRIRLVLLVVLVAFVLVACPEEFRASPTLMFSEPANGDEFVRLDTTVVMFFDTPLDPASVSNSTIQVRDGASSQVAGDLVYDTVAQSVTFTPGSNLLSGELYTVTVVGLTSDIGITSEMPQSWQFTTLTPITIDWGRLFTPLSITVTPIEYIPATALVQSNGVTDQTVNSDPDPRLLAQVGIGAQGSDPSAGGWNWYDTEPSDIYTDDFHDMYNGYIDPAPIGTYDVAARLSGDRGMTWVYCDTVDNSYDTADAGEVTVAE